MGIFIKNEDQIARMRVANQIVAGAHRLLEKAVRPGITTKELSDLAENYIVSQGAYPSFKGCPAFVPGAKDFPAAICASVNEEVIHGIPGLKKLKDGDIVSIDIGAVINGFHGDAARTHPVGKTEAGKLRLIEVTRESFFAGIMYARAGRHLHEISAAIAEVVEGAGFSVVRDFVGHGIGRQMHEEPQIPHYRMQSRGPRLQKGMTLAIEPMVNMSGCGVRILPDNWTVVTQDGSWSAHYENTIVITDGEPEILSLYESQ